MTKLNINKFDKYPKELRFRLLLNLVVYFNLLGNKDFEDNFKEIGEQIAGRIIEEMG